MNDDTLLLRQVNPSWVQHGRVTSQAFRPTPKDQHKLSAYDGDQISAEKSWVHYTTTLKFSSIGTLAVTVMECKQQELPAAPDPEPFPEHVVIDFTGFGKSQVEHKSKKLKAAAEVRGWKYRAIENK